jgi:hypothetical protein
LLSAHDTVLTFALIHKAMLSWRLTILQFAWNSWHNLAVESGKQLVPPNHKWHRIVCGRFVIVLASRKS